MIFLVRMPLTILCDLEISDLTAVCVLFQLLTIVNLYDFQLNEKLPGCPKPTTLQCIVLTLLQLF